MSETRELVVSIAGGSRFRSFTASDGALDGIATVINATDIVDSAFVRGTARLPEQDIARQTGATVAKTPSYRGREGFLDAAPGGVNVAASAAVKGGRGAAIRVFDAEGDWELAHEDRPSNLLGVVFGPAAWPGADRDHGTAVMGVVAAADNGFGVTGIAPDASVGMIRFEVNFTNTWKTIRDATDQVMRAGDILVLPITRAGGPNGKLIPIEWWPDDFDAIQHATSNGIIVVAAAGNDGENLDDPIYDTPMAAFLPTWRNPFRRGAADSGSILVGAGLPPGAGLDRSRDPDSNFGSCVDAQGWSLNICTTGYGDVQAGGDPKRFYTSGFGKTSGSSAMIAAVLACAQGARVAAGKPPWTSLEARAALRASGSPQQSASGGITEPIGNRPDLAALIALATA